MVAVAVPYGEVTELLFDSKEEWLRGRCDYLCSTDIPVLFHECERFQSLRSLWSTKRHRIAGLVNEESAEAAHGRRMEPLIIEDFERAMKCKVEMPKSHRLLTREGSIIACSIDGLMLGDRPIDPTGRRPVECKTAWRDQAKKWDLAVPIEYQLQMMTQLAVLGADEGYFAVWLYKGAAPVFRLHPIKRDDDVIAAIYKRAEQFWDMIKNGQAPAIDGSPHTTQTLRAEYRTSYQDEVELENPILVDARDQLKEIEENIKVDEKERQRIRNLFMAALGHHETGRLADGRRVYWKKDRRGNRALRFDREKKQKTNST